METPPVAFIPVEPDYDYATMDYEQQIAHTQRVKARVLHKLSSVSPDGGVPTDKDSVELLLKVADSMDRTTLNHRKNRIEETNGNNSADILTAIANIVIQHGNVNPLMSAEPVVNRTDIEELSSDALGNFHHNDGESHVGVISETVSSFTSRMDSIADELRRKELAELGLDEN